MKFDSSMVAVLLAAPVPAVLILAVMWDRHQRKRTEKSPQTTKLLRPPGHSLSIRLDDVLDSLVFSLLMAMVLCAFSADCVVMLAGFCGAKAPLAVLAVSLVVTTLFVVVCLWFTLSVFRNVKQAKNIRLGLRGEQAVAESIERSGRLWIPFISRFSCGRNMEH